MDMLRVCTLVPALLLAMGGCATASRTSATARSHALPLGAAPGLVESRVDRREPHARVLSRTESLAGDARFQRPTACNPRICDPASH